MGKFDNPKYDDSRRWIQKWREAQTDWDSIKLARKNTEEECIELLQRKVEDDGWPDFSLKDWEELVDEMKESEKYQQSFVIKGSEGTLFDTHDDNGLKVPQATKSCWQMYKKALPWDDDSKGKAEAASIGILRRLSKDTTHTGPIKGLVVGHVQSGKTANMEALMAMAADHGWNMFIVLSGSIEALRLQTMSRMQEDLNKDGNLTWIKIEHPSSNASVGDRLQDLHLNEESRTRYLTICLKQSTRLKNLINWIHMDANSHRNLKILIIDDEADQAGISNTASSDPNVKKERKGINKLIVNLVQDIKEESHKDTGKAKAVNYVMYTATPYANFLNESGEESLYPRNFIWTLWTSKEYIGPNQIFGGQGSDGIDIKRIIPEKDFDEIKQVHSGQSLRMPESMEDSICWFICSVAVMRYWEYKKPISMLIHTSQLTKHHAEIAELIRNWFITNHKKSGLVGKCRELYEREIQRFSKEQWRRQLPEFGRPAEDIKDYPKFDEIEDYVKVILNHEMTHIKMDDEGELKYHEGIHLVVDNSLNKWMKGEEDHIRLAYPDKHMDPYPSPAPAFIVIGGNTLSRGLTIEGLVSTYFLRGSCQADSLLQMGRWFGFRRDYELLPRLWMTEDTLDKFRFLSDLEEDLREDLKRYMHTDVTPAEYGPRVMVSPKVSWLRITSRNHMKGAIPADMDFSGAKPQTIVFDNNPTHMQDNIALSERFIDLLPGEPKESYVGSDIFWDNVPVSLITDKFLTNGFHFCERSRVFNEPEVFCEWIKKVVTEKYLDNWSVILAGVRNKEDVSRDRIWNVRGRNLVKVERTRVRNVMGDDSCINIRILRSIRDCVADIDGTLIREYENKNGLISKEEDVFKLREIAGVKEKPYMIIYRIDKNSKKDKKDTEREDLNVPHDLIGIFIRVPGDRYNKSYTERVTVRLQKSVNRDYLEDEQ